MLVGVPGLKRAKSPFLASLPPPHPLLSGGHMTFPLPSQQRRKLLRLGVWGKNSGPIPPPIYSPQANVKHGSHLAPPSVDISSFFWRCHSHSWSPLTSDHECASPYQVLLSLTRS